MWYSERQTLPVRHLYNVLSTFGSLTSNNCLLVPCCTYSSVHLLLENLLHFEISMASGVDSSGLDNLAFDVSTITCFCKRYHCLLLWAFFLNKVSINRHLETFRLPLTAIRAALNSVLSDPVGVKGEKVLKVLQPTSACCSLEHIYTIWYFLLNIRVQ